MSIHKLISFENIHFWPKIYLILYSSPENSTTRSTIDSEEIQEIAMADPLKEINTSNIQIVYETNDEDIEIGISRVLLLCQIWIVNYYVKCLSDNLSKKNKNTDFSREKKVHFGILIHVLS